MQPDFPPKKKRKKPVSLGSRVSAEVKRVGGFCGRVDRFISLPNGRQFHQDLFQFIDTIAVIPGGLELDRIVAIQYTTKAHINERVRKIINTPEIAARARRWLLAGGHVEVWGWSKMGPRGKRKTWHVQKAVIFPLTEGLEALYATSEKAQTPAVGAGAE